MNSFELKKELMGFEKEELIQIIIDLYKKEKVAARYIDYFLRPNEKEILQDQMQKVSDAFFPKRGFGLKLKDARSAVSEFKKFEPAPKLYASLMLFYVECGVKFAGEYGFAGDTLFESLIGMYRQALLFMKKAEILAQFRERSYQIVAGIRGDFIADFMSDEFEYCHFSYYGADE